MGRLDGKIALITGTGGGQGCAAAILFAQRVFFHREDWSRLQRNGMVADFSWDRSAATYEAVYRRAREVRGLPW